MKCEEPGGCPREAVGTDIVGAALCREHLEFSAWVQRLCNTALRDIGHPELIPDEAQNDDGRYN